MNMEKLELRPYQSDAVGAIKDALRKKETALLAAPCAAGKTVIFSEIIHWLHSAGRRCLVLLDRENLVTQTANRLREYIGSDVSIACASVGKKNLRKNVVVASRQTLAPMLRNGHKSTEFNIVILDEAHLCAQNGKGQYAQILKQLKENNPRLRLLGCTATPYRMAGGKIYGDGKLFANLDHAIKTQDLLDAGYLVPLTWKIRQSDLLRQLDLVKKSSTGELNETEQAAILGQATFVQGVYDVWLQYAVDRKTAVFALNIAHAEAIQGVFKANGVKTYIIHSKLSVDIVRTRIEAFAKGDGVIINVGILTIGSDIPAISAIILARRTMSTALFFQIIGRGARLFPGKTECLVLDLCGNALIHGIDPDNPIRQEHEEGKGEPKVKVCPMCETPCGLNAATCNHCGFQFPLPEREEEDLHETGKPGELVDFQGFVTQPCRLVIYRAYRSRTGSIPTIEAGYFGENGPAVRQWLCPEHPHKTFPQLKAARYWRDLGGKYPIPRTVAEWLQRDGELSQNLLLTLDISGKYTQVKKVKNADA